MFSNLFKMDRFHTCSKHNYTGTQPCPSCIWEEKEYIRALKEIKLLSDSTFTNFSKSKNAKRNLSQIFEIANKF